MGEVKTKGNISTFLALLVQNFWPVLKENTKSRKASEDKYIPFLSHRHLNPGSSLHRRTDFPFFFFSLVLKA